MPDTAKQVLTSRSESHSDVSDTKPARAHQAALTEKTFGEKLLKSLREANGEVRLTNLREEWVTTEGGLIYEISVDLTPVE